MAVTPKPASTVVLMDAKSRVYLTKRPITMKFLGGYYVFPGGSVETEDNIIASEYINNPNPSELFHPAHYIAAARELFEEVGIFLGNNKDGTAVQFTNQKQTEYRRLLINAEISFIEMLKQEGLQLNLESLTYFGYRVTPKERPYRFDTRFFLAQLPEGQSPNPDREEIDEAFWVAPEEALSEYQNGKLSMVRPTISSLRTIINYQNGGPLMMPNDKPSY